MVLVLVLVCSKQLGTAFKIANFGPAYCARSFFVLKFRYV
jgi:hypothetical protein